MYWIGLMKGWNVFLIDFWHFTGIWNTFKGENTSSLFDSSLILGILLTLKPDMFSSEISFDNQWIGQRQLQDETRNIMFWYWVHLILENWRHVTDCIKIMWGCLMSNGIVHQEICSTFCILGFVVIRNCWMLPICFRVASLTSGQSDQVTILHMPRQISLSWYVQNCDLIKS